MRLVYRYFDLQAKQVNFCNGWWFIYFFKFVVRNPTSSSRSWPSLFLLVNYYFYGVFVFHWNYCFEVSLKLKLVLYIRNLFWFILCYLLQRIKLGCRFAIHNNWFILKLWGYRVADVPVKLEMLLAAPPTNYQLKSGALNWTTGLHVWQYRIYSNKRRKCGAYSRAALI